MKREEIIKEARTWIGTEWQHQACLKGVACDCVGLVRGIYQEVEGIKVEIPINYSQTWPLHRSEEKMYKIFCKYCREIAVKRANLGDILLFGFGSGPAHHCGIVSYNNFIIHTWMEIGVVTESRIDNRWRANCRYAFAFPGVEE